MTTPKEEVKVSKEAKKKTVALEWSKIVITCITTLGAVFSPVVTHHESEQIQPQVVINNNYIINK